jgi:PPP family 3-phenylpropionic acid transporter
VKSFTFSFYTMMALVVSYFPLYFDARGYSKIQIGMLYSIGPMIGIVTNLTWGFLSDKFQTIKKIFLVLLAGQLVMAFIFFHVHSFALLYLCMAAFFFFQQPMTSLNDSQLLLIVTRTGKSYASFRVYGSTGFAFAALFFGMLLRYLGAGATVYLSLLSICVSLVLCLFLKDVRGGRAYKPMDLGEMLKIVSSRKFLWFLLLIMIMSIAHRTNDGFLALYLRQLGANESIVGYAWMVSAISEIPMFLFLSKYGHRYKELPLLALAGFLYIVRFLLISIISDPRWGIAIQAMHSVTFGIFLFTALRYIQQIVPDEYRASGQAIFAVTWSSLAGLISGTLGGWIFDAWGGRTLYLTAAGMALIAAVGFTATHVMEGAGPGRPASRGQSVK